MTTAELDVTGVGNAIVDVLANANDDFLDAQGIAKGAMTLIDEARAEALYAAMGPGHEISGGSAANTIAGVASFGGRAGFIGKLRDDQLGQVFRHDLTSLGVQFPTPPATGGPATARCLINVTPDAQRSMCTYLGAAALLGPDEIDRALIEKSAIVYFEGYLFDRPEAKAAYRIAAEIAHGAGREVALSLSDSFCVDRHRDDFLDLIDGHIDLLFANEDEILSLFQTEDFADAARRVRGHCEATALTRSEKGSVILPRGGEDIDIAALPPKELVDTTGAGDQYAAGFLFGKARGRPLEECGRLGAIAASEVISHYGARPDRNLKELAAEHGISI